MALNYASSQSITLPSALNSLATGSAVQTDVINTTSNTLKAVDASGNTRTINWT